VSGHDIVVIGASAGGVDAVSRVVKRLPADLDAAVFVVLHISPSRVSALPAILDREGPLPAAQAEDGGPIQPGRIYVAAPDRHLIVRPRHMSLVNGPRENRVRPAVDSLFRSAAVAFPGRTIGVVLTGNLDDGAAGLAAIKRCGGLAVVQDPAEALSPSMPRSAIEATEVDHVVPVDEIGALVARLTAAPAVNGAAVPKDLLAEVASSLGLGEAVPVPVDRTNLGINLPATLGCPECGGGLNHVQNSNIPRYRCQVGHAFSARALLDALGDELERALWAALRTLEERVSILDVLSRDQAARDRQLSSQQYRDRAEELRGYVDRIRDLLLSGLNRPEPALQETGE
jgi:two-component system chemotaxis response regulator CheB